MATYATLTVPVADIIGADFNASRASAWIEAGGDDGVLDVIVVDGTNVRAGGRREQVTAGVATFSGLVATNSADNPTSFYYRVKITAPPKGAQNRSDIVNIVTAWFPLTADANLAAIEEAWDNLTAPVLWRSDFRDEMQALKDAASAISGADTADELITVLDADAGSTFRQQQDARLTATFAQPRSASLAAIGDSITWANGPLGTAPTLQYYPNRSWFQHAAAALGQRVTLAHNYGVVGDTAADVLADQVGSVVALDPPPAACIVNVGTNDVNTSRTSAAIIADLTAIYDALDGKNIRIIAGTIIPGSLFTFGQNSVRHTVNRWIKAQARTRPNFHVVDWATTLTAADGTPRADVMSDDLHPSPRGAAIMGDTLAPILGTLFPPVDLFLPPGDTANLIPYPYMLGSEASGTSGFTGVLATGWVISNIGGTLSVVGSKVARTDNLPGEWQQFDVTSGDFEIGPNFAIAGGYTGTIQLRVEMEFHPDFDANAIEVYVYSTTPYRNRMALARNPDGEPATANWGQFPDPAVLETPPMTLAGTEGLYVVGIRCREGRGVLRVGRTLLLFTPA